jgi:hypothetical protein
MTENSPASRRWERGEKTPSPEGTAESRCLSRPFGTKLARLAHPALKRWAILICPYETGSGPRLPDGGNRSNPRGIVGVLSEP